jgi:hypothetical protein
MKEVLSQAATMILAVLALVVLLLAAARCRPAASPPREQARAVILTLAEAVRVGDESCAAIALSRRDLTLARYCADAYEDARNSLIAAGESFDHWSSGPPTAIVCSVVAASHVLARVADVLKRRGEQVAVLILDAIRLGTSLGVCPDAESASWLGTPPLLQEATA